MGRPWWYNSYWKRQGNKRTDLKRSAIRLFLNLVVLAAFVGLCVYSHLLFTHQLEPLAGSIVLLIGTAAWILLIQLLRRRYGQEKPSFKLTTFLVLVILLVFAFAGVQPLATYKNSVIQWAQAKITPVASDIRHSLFPTDEEIRADTFTLVNKARVEAGLAPLVRDSTLDSLAQEHCDYMKRVGNVNHDNFEERAARSGRDYVGENCAEGYHDAESLVSGWLSSPGHKANIMDPYFVYTGLGYTGGYACQIFSD